MADSNDYYMNIPCGTCGHAGSVHEMNDSERPGRQACISHIIDARKPPCSCARYEPSYMPN